MTAKPRGLLSGESTAHSIRPAGPRRIRAGGARIYMRRALDDAAVPQVLLDDLVDVGAVDIRCTRPRPGRPTNAGAFLAAIEAPAWLIRELCRGRKARVP